MNVAVLTAGGIGSRAHQDLPKQFLTVENKPILIYTLEAFQQHPSIDEIYVSCLDGWSAVLEAYAKQFNITKLKRIVTGGATGQESIYNGLKAIKEDNEETKDIVVIIHDGNRPMLPQDVITDNLVKQKLFGSAVTVIPTTEVVFVSKDGEESNVALNREELWRTQTPHSYRFDELWTVHNQAIEDGVGEDIILKSKGQQRYSYCYIADAVSGLLKLLLDGQDGEAYNISNDDDGLTLGEYAEYIASLANLKVRYEIENNESVSKATFALLDTHKIKNIGWKPQYSVKDGLKRTYMIKKEQLTNVD